MIVSACLTKNDTTIHTKMNTSKRFSQPILKIQPHSLTKLALAHELRASIVRCPEVMSGGDDRIKEGTDVGVITKTRTQTKRPSLYKVLLLNDDYTPMEFVVHILEGIFSKSREEATQIMLMVHTKGVGVCGVYPYDVAETKVNQVLDFAQRHQHPLKCTLEKE